MKVCPQCNQQFSDEWLTFCTQDGTSLIEVVPGINDPASTVKTREPWSGSPVSQPSPPPPVAPPATYRPPQTPQAGWSPPPPPVVRVDSAEKTLAVASMVLGLVSITIGWCCYFGVLTGPIAIGLGLYSLSQIRKDPKRYGGKGMAIAGIVTGALYFVFMALIALIYGLSFMMGGLG